MSDTGYSLHHQCMANSHYCKVRCDFSKNVPLLSPKDFLHAVLVHHHVSSWLHGHSTKSWANFVPCQQPFPLKPRNLIRNATTSPKSKILMFLDLPRLQVFIGMREIFGAKYSGRGPATIARSKRVTFCSKHVTS